jgi:hypothetical protein
MMSAGEIHMIWLAALVLALNLPFGWLRNRTRKFSLPWFLCIHAPIPLVIVARVSLGVGYSFIPILVAVSAAGQVAGGRFLPGRAGRT